MVRKIVVIAISVTCLFIIGCGGFDQNQVAQHPEATLPSSTFDVTLVNSFIYLDSTATLGSSVKRDNLHLLVGLPASWNVVEAKLAVVSDMDIKTMMAMQEDTIDEQTLNGMIAKYQSGAVAMQSDASLKTAISGMTIAATGRDGVEDSVEVDKVENWIGFSGPVNIVMEKGSALDTVLPLDTMNALMGDSVGDELMDPMMKAFMPDSIGMSFVPIVVYLKVQSGSTLGSDTLYYFTKTGSMNISAVSGDDPMSLTMNLDVGSMCYAPITVSNDVEVQQARASVSALTPAIFTNKTAGTVTINLGSTDPRQASIGIYSIAGELVSSLTPARVTLWNGTDRRGNRVPVGTYLVKVATARGMVVQNVQMVR